MSGDSVLVMSLLPSIFDCFGDCRSGAGRGKLPSVAADCHGGGWRESRLAGLFSVIIHQNRRIHDTFLV